MQGIWGSILVVDLADQSTGVVRKDDAFFRKNVGGGLLCARLFQELTAGRGSLGPFDEANPIIFAGGPLAGRDVCGATRVNVLSLSPEAPGIYLSQAGGEFGPALKRAGYDALVVTGKADTPVMVTVTDQAVQIVDAAHLWGLDRPDTCRRILADIGDDYTVATIGPAGENRVCWANIMFEPDHYAGRGGLGAVMGAKRLKAIAVTGDRKVRFADAERVKAINNRAGRSLTAAIKASPGSFMSTLRDFGTFGLIELNQKVGNLPTRNFSSGQPDAADVREQLTRKIAGERHVGQRRPCRNCFVACKKKARQYPEFTALPEYESVALLGANLGLAGDLHTCFDACERCNRLGLDTISTGNMIAGLMDGFENGMLNPAELGFSVRFGDGASVLSLIEEIAHRSTTIGALMAGGLGAVLDGLGHELKPFFRIVNGIGMPAHMPRKKPGVGFSYLHGPNPCDHMKIEHDWIAADPQSLMNFGLTTVSEPAALDHAKIEALRATQFYYGAMDALSLCLFVFGPGNVYTFDQLVDLINAATGLALDVDGLMEIGERSVQLQRQLFLQTGGMDGDLPSFMTEPVREGPSKGACIRAADFHTAREHYYKVMGWDRSGAPTRETLARLGL